MITKTRIGVLFALVIPCIGCLFSQHALAELVFADDFELMQYTPSGYQRALRNPLKGFTNSPGQNEWATLRHQYIRWNELENHESDGLDRILQLTDDKFSDGPDNNMKFIPRVYLHWYSDNEKYWPEDMQDDDYTSQQFQTRALRLIERLGIAWNNDPRIAFIELGIFGKWGEHHSPDPTAEMQQLVGQAFTDAFPNKKISVRHVWDQFEDFNFGEYWDSWAHYNQMWPHGNRISDVNTTSNRYVYNYIGGEVAYNWGDSFIQPGDSPTDSIVDPNHRQFVINSVRWLHNTQLRWIANYDHDNTVAREAAEDLQKAMGYRYILQQVGFTSTVTSDGLRVTFTVKNEGSAPFYYHWPVEVALLNPTTREVVWSNVFSDVDIRDWQPGNNWTPPQWESITGWPFQAVVEGWSDAPIGWSTPPASYTESGLFFPDVAAGEYVLTLAILDPAGMLPALRFATSQYWNGGRHPIGLIGIDQVGLGRLPDSFTFDDPFLDNTLHYAMQ